VLSFVLVEYLVLVLSAVICSDGVFSNGESAVICTGVVLVLVLNTFLCTVGVFSFMPKEDLGNFVCSFCNLCKYWMNQLNQR